MRLISLLIILTLISVSGYSQSNIKLLNKTKAEVIQIFKKQTDWSAPIYQTSETGLETIIYRFTDDSRIAIGYYFENNRCINIMFMVPLEFKDMFIDMMHEHKYKYVKDDWWYNSIDKTSCLAKKRGNYFVMEITK